MVLIDIVARLKTHMDTLAEGGPWRGRIVAFFLGTLAVFSMAPLYQVYVLIPAFSGLLWLSAGQPTKWRAFAVGWWFGAGYFAVGLYWIDFALLVPPEKFVWLIPIATLGFGFGLGLFPALSSLLVRASSGRRGTHLAAQACVLAGSWMLLEWVRGWIFTGFPWNLIGSAGAFSNAFLQGASVSGVYGLSLLLILTALAPGVLAERSRAARGFAVFTVIAFFAVWVGGAYRLSHATDAVVKGVRLRLVQPNFAQATKWDPRLLNSHMLTQIDMSLAPPAKGEPTPTHIIWAETAAPLFLASNPFWLKLVGRAVPKGGLIILGAPRKISEDAQGNLTVANSILAIGQNGKVQATYDKFHLVPFGEYMPKWLPLNRITQGEGSFTPGPGPVTLRLLGLPPVSPLICYEVIFPGHVTDGSGRAAWILNLTNDAWFGKTAGPYQHFVNARLRAVEQGIPVVRDADTGISAIIDAYGRVRKMLPLGKKGFIDGDLPVRTPHPSLYSRFGNTGALILAVLVLLGGIWRTRSARKRHRFS